MELVRGWSTPCDLPPVAAAGAVAAAVLAAAGTVVYSLEIPAASHVVDVFRAQDRIVVLLRWLVLP